MRWAIAALLALACAPAPAAAHDVYHGLLNPYTGQLCCGGDPETGDCEGIPERYFMIRPTGDALLYSKRYGVWVLVPREKVMEKHVQDADGNVHHWCGKPAITGNVNGEMITICLFVPPSGS